MRAVLCSPAQSGTAAGPVPPSTGIPPPAPAWQDRGTGGGHAGGLLLAVPVFAGSIIGGDLLGVSQAGGAHAMAVAFVWTPLGFLVGAVLGAVAANRR